MNKNQIKNYATDSNFSTLLDVPMDGQILVVGNGFDWVGKFFKNIRYDGSGDQCFDIIFYSPSAPQKNLSIKNEVRKLKKKLSERGFLFLLFDNSFSFSTVKHLIKKKSVPQKSRAHTNFISFLYLINSCGFPYFRAWAPVADSGDDFNEIVDLKCGRVDTIHYEHWLVRFLNWLGMKHYVHDSFLAICGQRSIEDGEIFCKINEIIRGEAETDVMTLQLIRFDLRARGALVAFIKEQNGGGKIIARIVGNAKTNLIIQKNNDFLGWLHNDSQLPTSLKKFIPFPIGKTSLGSTKIYIERMITGVPAWKADNIKLKKKIYQQADKFITDFGIVTSKSVLVGEKFFSEMFKIDLDRIENCETIGIKIKGLLHNLLNRVKQILLGTTVITVASHGDYGYGNILVSQTDGKLTGVIDWDTGRKREFFWVDRLNMEIQLLINIKQETLFRSLRYLWNMIGQKEKFTLYDSDYKRNFQVSSKMLQLLAIITMIRFVIRSLQYPHLFRNVTAEYENSLEFLTKSL